MDNFHTPVLLEEVIDGLKIERDGLYIDATLGGGGHTEKILGLGGKLLGIDQDEEALEHVKKRFESEITQGQLVLARGNFADIEEIAEKNNFSGVNGILFDLGVSSFQLDKSGRGFSFLREEELDMRMSQETSLTAKEIINSWSEDSLIELIAKYGEEPNAVEVAHEIVFRRREKPIVTSMELAKIVRKVVPNTGMINPATRTLQALRIAVNDELEVLRKGLAGGFKLLKGEGRMEVISFHSLEDRITKLYFIELSNSGTGKIITKKPIIAKFEETKKNRRSRSAKMRVIERV